MRVLYVAKRAMGENIVNKQELKILMGGRGTTTGEQVLLLLQGIDDVGISNEICRKNFFHCLWNSLIIY